MSSIGSTVHSFGEILFIETKTLETEILLVETKKLETEILSVETETLETEILSVETKTMETVTTLLRELRVRVIAPTVNFRVMNNFW